MANPKFSIRQLLTGLSVMALVSVLIVSGMAVWLGRVASSTGETLGRETDQSLALAKQAQDASASLAEALNILVARSGEDLQGGLSNAAELQDGESLADITARFKNSGQQLMTVKSQLLKNRETMKGLSDALERLAFNIQSNAGSLQGKSDLMTKREKRAIRRSYQSSGGNNLQALADEMYAFIQGDSEVVSSLAAELTETSARLSTVTYQLQTLNNLSELVSLEQNTAVPLMKKISGQLEGLAAAVGGNEDLAALVSAMQDDRQQLESLMYGADGSLMRLREQNIRLNESLSALSTGMMDQVMAMNELSVTRGAEVREKSRAVRDANEARIEGIASASLMVCLIVCVALAVLSILITRFVTKPLYKIKKAMKDIAEGEGDLTKRLNVTGVKEAIELSAYFNRFAERLQMTISAVSKVADHLRGSVTSATEIAHRSRNAIQRQTTETAQVATAMEAISQSFAETAQSAGNALESARLACEESQSGSQTVDTSAACVARLAKDIESGVASMERLTQTSQNVISVLSVISEITEQTNLLALNAAIEAARAGEQGRGFAVVADEVRSLAGRTHTSAEEISGILDTLNNDARQAMKVMSTGQGQVSESVELSHKVAQALTQISSAIQSIRDLNTQIHTGAETQSLAVSEAARSIEQINQIGNESLHTADEIRRSADHLSELATSLQDTLSQFRY
ncbi:MAG TPA: hypothetical protein DEA26_04965 [Oceanospirillales bacterium]|nr:hypothetical protein [Oceanospirillales bacterium]